MNPLASRQAPQNAQAIKQTLNTLKMAQSPTGALTAMAQSNPAINSVLQLCKGRDPKTVFYEECNRRGINPDDVLAMMR